MKVLSFLRRNMPTILTVVGCVGVPLSSYLTGKAVLEAEKVMEETPEEEMKSVETQKKLVKVYIWAFVANALTITDIVACHLMNKKIQAGYLAACGVLSSTLEAWRAKTSPEERERIQREIDEEKINAVIEKLVNERPNEESELWIDDYREHPYWATKSDILLGKDDVNKCLNGENYNPNFNFRTSLEVFYSHVKGKPEPQDYIFGWDVEQLLDECDTDHINKIGRAHV